MITYGMLRVSPLAWQPWYAAKHASTTAIRTIPEGLGRVLRDHTKTRGFTGNRNLAFTPRNAALAS